MTPSPSLGPRVEATLWPSAICSSLPENFEREEGPHVVATIVSNDCMQDWYCGPLLMPDPRRNLITCGAVCINNETKFSFATLTLEFLYRFDWLEIGNLFFFFKISLNSILLGEFYLDILLFNAELKFGYL